jgi:acyl-coenzyme A synthetase/AMP-(fatty) acid ligase
VKRPEFTLHDLLHNSVECDPAHVAIVDGSAEYTYEDLARQSASLCAALQDVGVRKGDRVGILLEKTWEAIVAMLAASMAGAAYVNINPLFKAPQVRYIADDCDIRVLIGDSGKLEELEPGTIAGTAFYKGEEPSPEAAGSLVDVTQALSSGDTPKETRQVSEVDLGTILYTSGSTGMPKGVATSQRNIVVGAQIVSTYLENTPEDRILSALPLNFDAGMSQFTTSLRAGATLVLQRSRLPGDLLKGLRRHRITGVTGVPPLWALLLRGAKTLEEEPLTHLRYLANTGGRIPQANLDEMRRLLAMGYWGKEEATRKAYRPNPVAPPELLDVERVVYSGDLVRRDEEGFLYFIGREDAMIKTQGYRLSPEEVEGLLVGSGKVREACAFGVEDPEVGQQVYAVVSLRDGDASVEEIREYVIKNGPPYMVPKEIFVQDELPKTGSGKIDRKGISNAYAGR